MITALLLAAAVTTDAAALHARFNRKEQKQLAPLLREVLRFPTVAGRTEAHAAQQAWLRRVGCRLGLVVRDAGMVTEIELPGPPGAPVLGLIVHGDVQPVEESAWSFPPFAGIMADGEVRGRGAADDKGPLVQALLAMKTLKESRLPRTHTVRLLVGSDEESGSTDMAKYLADHKAPDLSLVLDALFPVVFGEKAWDALEVTAPNSGVDEKDRRFVAVSLDAGLAPSIVPDRARLVLRWNQGDPYWKPLLDRFREKPLREGTRLETATDGSDLTLTMLGRAAHSGVNIEGGRNALVSLADMVHGELPPSGLRDLLAFAHEAGRDLHGTGLALTHDDPLWGGYAVNVATVKPTDDGQWRLTINIRRPPPQTAPQLEQHLTKVVADFRAAADTGPLTVDGYFKDEPLVFDREARIIKRLQAAYARATGEALPPAVCGGGTYAKRLPNAIAFGMWFPGKPYPGHDVDERIPLADLVKGAHVLLEALADLACAPPLSEPFRP